MPAMYKPDQFIPGPVQLTNPLDVVTRALPKLVDSQGQWTPANAAAEFFDTVEIRTKVTPPILLNVRTLDAPGKNPILDKIKPAVILTGPVGTKVIAPYGEVPDGVAATYNAVGSVIGFAMVAGLAGFVAGRLVEKRKARRRGGR